MFVLLLGARAGAVVALHAREVRGAASARLSQNPTFTTWSFS